MRLLLAATAFTGLTVGVTVMLWAVLAATVATALVVVWQLFALGLGTAAISAAAGLLSERK